jgi:uncharacterized protein YndB with AHSA1/START domain
MRNAAMNECGKLVDDHAVLFERLLPGSMAHVWCFLTTRELLATWLGEGCFECKIGGSVRLYAVGSSIMGAVTECRPYSRLGWSMLPNLGSSDGQIGWDSYVKFELKPRSHQVLLTLTHTPVPYVHAPRVLALWHALLDRLSASMSQVRPEPLMRRVDRVLPRYEHLLTTPGAPLPEVGDAVSFATERSYSKAIQPPE